MFYKEYKYPDIEVLNKLKQDVKENVLDWYAYKTNIKGLMTGYKRYTKEARNLFQPIIDLLSTEYHIYESWGGLLRKGDHIILHNHTPKPRVPNRNFTISGIVYLTDVLPGTYFKKYDTTIVPEVGKIVIFDANTLHEVKKSDSDGERINIAFNGRRKESYEF